MAFGIGSKVWVHDERLRLTEAERQNPFAPYPEDEVVGETSRSWLLKKRTDLKVPKQGDGQVRLVPVKTYRGRGAVAVYLDRFEVEEQVWCNLNRYQILQHVQNHLHGATAGQLRELMRIFPGYVERGSGVFTLPEVG